MKGALVLIILTLLCSQCIRMMLVSWQGFPYARQNVSRPRRSCRNSPIKMRCVAARLIVASPVAHCEQFALDFRAFLPLADQKRFSDRPHGCPDSTAVISVEFPHSEPFGRVTVSTKVQN